MKKSVSFLLALTMSLGMATAFSACGGGDKYDPNNFLTLEEATALGTPNKIVKEKTTLRIFVPRGSMNPRYDDMRMFKVLEEETNLDLQFIEAQEDNYSNQRTLAWEDKKNLPDLFLYNNTISEIVRFSKLGALAPFNDPNYKVDGVKAGSLIDNYMPTYKALLEDDFGLELTESATDIMTIRNGLMYSSASVNDVPRDLTFKFYINQTWIDHINENCLPAGEAKLPNAGDIKTIEEYLTVLRAFKKYDANNNGNANDEVPVSADNLNYLRNLILASYGYVSQGTEINTDGSGFVYVASTEAYKKYLETASLMYSEGLLDDQTFANVENRQQNLGFENQLGSFSAAAANIVVGDLDPDYTTFGPLTSEYYTGTPLAYSKAKVNQLGAVIPSTTKKVREVARFLDILYSDLGVSLCTFGQENVDWEWMDETKTAWVKTIPESWESGEEDYRSTLTPNVGLGVSVYNKADFVIKESGTYTQKLNQLSERYKPYLKEPIPAYIKLTEKEYSEESRIGSELEKSVESWEYKFVKGTKSVSNDWNAYLQEIERMGYKNMVKLYNDAYARYKNA